MTSCSLLTFDDPEWTRVLTRLPHDVYHLPEYFRFSAAQEEGTALAFYAERRGTILFAPFILRELPSRLGAPGHWRDAISPYGYPSLLTTPDAEPAALEELLQAFVRTCLDQQIVAAFFRLHPLLTFPVAALEPFGHVVDHGQTVYIDLEPPLDQIIQQFKWHHRAAAKKLRLAGFTTTFDDWTRLPQFSGLYLQTMRRVLASHYYLFQHRYFEELHSALGPHLHICCVVAQDGDLAAAALCSERNGIVQYLFGGTAERFLPQSPAKLLFDAITRWAKQWNNAYFHLGGGVGAQADSLFQFKAGFSRHRSHFQTFRVVLDESRYAHLVDRSLVQSERVVASNFFPAYRVALSEAVSSAGQARA